MLVAFYISRWSHWSLAAYSGYIPPFALTSIEAPDLYMDTFYLALQQTQLMVKFIIQVMLEEHFYTMKDSLGNQYRNTNWERNLNFIPMRSNAK